MQLASDDSEKEQIVAEKSGNQDSPRAYFKALSEKYANDNDGLE